MAGVGVGFSGNGWVVPSPPCRNQQLEGGHPFILGAGEQQGRRERLAPTPHPPRPRSLAAAPPAGRRQGMEAEYIPEGKARGKAFSPGEVFRFYFYLGLGNFNYNVET